MANALSTGVSGLVTHQRMLDIVSNNLANINTTAFKTGQVRFADQLYSTIRPATGGFGETGGEVNPSEIGSGVRIAEVSRSFNQGNLEGTGETLDFAIQGDGFFVLNNGTRNLYTRDGSFGIDSFGYLVDPATGYRLQRYGTIGEPDGTDVGFQIPGENAIRVPIGATIPGEPTSLMTFTGNLDATALGPTYQELSSVNPFLVGGVAATAATLLNDLDSSTGDYLAANSDSIVISGKSVDGTTVNVTLAVDETTTVGDLVSAIDAAYGGATASLGTDGQLKLIADDTGPVSFTMSLADDPTNTGGLDFDTHRMTVITPGRDGDKVQTMVEVFDIRGGSHVVQLVFQKQDSNLWDLHATLRATDGTVLDDIVEEVRFGEDGTLEYPTDAGGGDASLEFRFTDMTASQTIAISLADVSQLAIGSSLVTTQDGSSAGTLTTVSITADGVLKGEATNGLQIPLAQLAIASFANLHGLEGEGENYYTESLSSGTASIGTALSGSRGSIRSGELEMSNVDIAQEFTRLIVAQRGFSANARTITVASQVLEELTNVVR